MRMGDIKILIVEDEQRLADVLKKQLEESGFAAEIAYDGYIGKQMTEKNAYNLIILDINLPLINGYDLCREIRKTNNKTPIIMLTAFGTPENKISGFDTGADDYVVKPFDFRELLARINVFLRRADPGTIDSEKIDLADLEMDLKTKNVTRAGRRIDLTAKESLLLETFLKNRHKLLTRDFIIEKVWGIDFDPSTNIIDVYVNYLRKKIDRDFEPKLIHTKFGFGFYCSDKEI
ncbi:MAG: DNA-binding response regulator [Bacteroidetes bacterium GWE2_41_25]|nr:MAG: DNA-binding response regulator [Bacteroidetes bacterium GWA2_40_15]OFX95805.1 MAG: DNA-binding response regulator [Bacteroidetes bacterium GWC2_40_22]OFY12587.1 MAG: DNA-binding response regulator [Bacteroidetes bacterium GWE2_41_25]OFY57504.1 MAG: DNA-binding response regulator [Bacteroidetes bacterium GWF2_41_9]